MSVEAGTFDAMPLTCQVNLMVPATIPGAAEQPFISKSDIQRWYAKGMGMAKSEYTGSAGVRTSEL
jgi:hypothetical protein